MAFDIVITDGKWRAEGWLTSEPVVPSLGYGGHPVGARPKKKALTVFEGRQPFQLAVPLLLFRGNFSHCEQDRIALDEMAVVEDNTPQKNQRSIYIHPAKGVILPIPPRLGNEPSWWIEDLAWGEELKYPPSEGGLLKRKNVTVTLLERVDVILLGETPQKAPTIRTKKYRVKKPPDTLASIAAKQLGSSSFASEIGILNSIRSSGELKNRQVISIPDSKLQPTTR